MCRRRVGHRWLPGRRAPAAAAAAGPPAAGFTLSFAKAFHFWTSPAATALMPGSSCRSDRRAAVGPAAVAVNLPPNRILMGGRTLASRNDNALLGRRVVRLSFLQAAAQRAADAAARLARPVAQEAHGLESLDANCLLNISRQYVVALPEGSLDRRNLALVRLAQVSHQLRGPLSPLLAEEFRQHRRRKNSLTRLAMRLGAQGSWGHQLRRVSATARAYRHDAQCQGGCGRSFKASRMFQLLDDERVDERHSKLVCAECTRRRYGLPTPPVSDDPGRQAVLVALSAGGDAVDWPGVRAAGALHRGIPLFHRSELTRLGAEGAEGAEGGEAAVEAAETLRYVLSASGYGFGGEYCAYVHREAPPLCDADCVVLCDALVSGLGRRCLWIDLSDSEVGDAGLVALARGLPACLSLLHLNLNGILAGDEGVAALAAALTPRPLSSLSFGARSLLPPQWAKREWEDATFTPRWGEVGTTAQTVAVPCPQLRWLYLVLDDLGDAGALALARALGCRATPKLECLWCCGAFSEASEPGAAGAGFTALTRACDERAERSSELHGAMPLRLELEHGFPWGM